MEELCCLSFNANNLCVCGPALAKGESTGLGNTAAPSECLDGAWMASEAEADQRNICFLASLATVWVSMVLSILTAHTTYTTNRLLKLIILTTNSLLPQTNTTILASFSSRVCSKGILSWWILVTLWKLYSSCTDLPPPSTQTGSGDPTEVWHRGQITLVCKLLLEFAV